VNDPIALAADAALAGRLIVLPTDTVYGIGTRPDDPSATRALFEAKGRPRDLELPVLVATVPQARAIAAFDDRADRVASLWPGAVTIVLPRTAASAMWDLGGTPETIGVRVPHDPTALAVLARTGPLAVTSANRSGRATPASCDGLQQIFGDLVDVYLCDEAPRQLSPSTVVDLSAPDARILRAGSLDAEIRRLVAR
jgi:tRNA threonylcarbamoyl adenosine modification protein (Sua5/YciO/YrdC/YwlC family)